MARAQGSSTASTDKSSNGFYVPYYFSHGQEGVLSLFFSFFASSVKCSLFIYSMKR
jgi:hypothetical protein